MSNLFKELTSKRSSIIDKIRNYANDEEIEIFYEVEDFESYLIFCIEGRYVIFSHDRGVYKLDISGVIFKDVDNLKYIEEHSYKTVLRAYAKKYPKKYIAKTLKVAPSNNKDKKLAVPFALNLKTISALKSLQIKSK